MRTTPRPAPASERLLSVFRNEGDNPHLFDDPAEWPRMSPDISPDDMPRVPSLKPRFGPAKGRSRARPSRLALADALDGGARG